MAFKVRISIKWQAHLGHPDVMSPIVLKKAFLRDKLRRRVVILNSYMRTWKSDGKM